MLMNIGTRMYRNISAFRSSYREIRHYPIVGIANRITALFTTLSVILIFTSYDRLPPRIPLWLSLPWGDDRLAETYFIFLPVIIAVAVHVINLAVATLVVNKYRIYIQIMMATSVFTVLLSFAAVMKILQLVM